MVDGSACQDEENSVEERWWWGWWPWRPASTTTAPPPPPPQVTFHAPCSGGVCENDIFVFLFFLIRYIQKHVLKIWNKTVSLYQNVSVAVSMSMMSGFVDVENN